LNQRRCNVPNGIFNKYSPPSHVFSQATAKAAQATSKAAADAAVQDLLSDPTLFEGAPDTCSPQEGCSYVSAKGGNCGKYASDKNEYIRVEQSCEPDQHSLGCLCIPKKNLSDEQKKLVKLLQSYAKS